MIDCNGLNLLSDSAQTKAGLYAECVNASKYNKPVFAFNCLWGETAITPIPVFIVPFDGYVVVTSSTLQVWVTSADSVTVHNMAPAQG